MQTELCFIELIPVSNNTNGTLKKYSHTKVFIINAFICETNGILRPDHMPQKDLDLVMAVSVATHKYT